MNVALCATTVGTVVGGLGVALAQLPAVDAALQAGGKAERLSALGITVALLIVSVLGNVWLLRSGILKLISMIESLTTLVTKAMGVLDCASAAVGTLKETSGELKQITQNCAMTHRTLEMGRRAYDPHGEGHHAG